MYRQINRQSPTHLPHYRVSAADLARFFCLWPPARCAVFGHHLVGRGGPGECYDSLVDLISTKEKRNKYIKPELALGVRERVCGERKQYQVQVRCTLDERKKEGGK